MMNRQELQNLVGGEGEHVSSVPNADETIMGLARQILTTKRRAIYTASVVMGTAEGPVRRTIAVAARSDRRAKELIAEATGMDPERVTLEKKGNPWIVSDEAVAADTPIDVPAARPVLMTDEIVDIPRPFRCCTIVTDVVDDVTMDEDADR